MQTEVTKLAHECGATYYSPAPMRAVRGLSFTYEQLESFALRLQSEQKQCLHQIQEPTVNQQLTNDRDSHFFLAGWNGARQEVDANNHFKNAYKSAPVQAAQTEGSVSNATLEVAPAAVAEQALLKVLHAIQRYMPPDGVSDRETLSEIIGIVDPWPLGDVPAAVAVPDAVRDAEKLLRAEAARLERIYNGHGNKWYGFSTEKAACIEHLRVADALAATPAADAQAVPTGWVPCVVTYEGQHPEEVAYGPQIMMDRLKKWLERYFEMKAAAPVVLPEPWPTTDDMAQAYEDAFKRKPVGQILANLVVLVEALHSRRALLATATGLPAQAVEQAPVLYVSKGQLDHHRDPDGPDSFNAGRYLPSRITPAGKFTTPLFAAPQAHPFQQRVQPWMMACFGPEISADRIERNHRFLEEALELVQSCGCTASEAHQLVDYVYGRPWGEPAQEVGGVMVTLAALCLANGLDMHACGETELARIWTKVEAIRAKQAAKPKHSPLPMHAPQAQADARDAGRYRFIVEKKLILSGGTEQFGWPIAPFGSECDRYIDAAIAAAKGE